MLKKTSLVLIAVLVLGLGLSGCSGSQQTSVENPPESEDSGGEPTVRSMGDGKDVVTMDVDGEEREFIVYRPATLEEDEEVPVVFMFHGSGQGGELFYRESGWKEKADEEGFMAIFPTALKFHIFSDEKVVNGEVETDVAAYQTKWNGFGLERALDPEYPDQTLADDVKFTEEMVGFVEENYAVDSNRFYASGFSNGGGFVSRLAVQMSDTFAAFGRSGSLNLGITDPESYVNVYTDAPFQPRPILTMVGENDEKMTYAMDVESFPMDESALEEIPLLSDGVTAFLDLLELENSPSYEKRDRASIFTFDQPLDEGGEQSYTLMFMEHMHHVFPNGNNYPVAAVDILWPFFEEHELN